MFLTYVLTLLFLPLAVGVALPLFHFVERRRVAVLRLLLTLSMVPWLVFVRDIYAMGVQPSLAQEPSLTLTPFIWAALPWAGLALVAWVLALAVARRLPWISLGLAAVVPTVTVFGLLQRVREAGMLVSERGEPYSWFSFDGLYVVWYFVFSVSAWLGLFGFVASAYWHGRRQMVGRSSRPGLPT